MHSHLVGDNGEHKKAQGVDKYVVATISHNEYRDVFLNKKCFRNSINRIQGKNHRVGTNEINNFSLFWFNGKIYILINETNWLLLAIRVDYNLLNIRRKFF